MGIGPRLPVRTVEWRTSLGQFSKEIDVDIDAEYVRKGRVDERFHRKTAGSVAQLGGRFSGSELSTSEDLPEIGDLPADWETVTYLPYV